MTRNCKIITSHLHSRIASLASDAIKNGLIISCDRTESDTYLLHKSGEFAPTEYKPIAVGVLLLKLLNKL